MTTDCTCRITLISGELKLRDVDGSPKQAALLEVLGKEHLGLLQAEWQFNSAGESCTCFMDLDGEELQ